MLQDRQQRALRVVLGELGDLCRAQKTEVTATATERVHRGSHYICTQSRDRVGLFSAARFQRGQPFCVASGRPGFQREGIISRIVFVVL
jgi:hypothetical protein